MTFADGGEPRHHNDIPTGSCVYQGGWETCGGAEDGDPWGVELFLGGPGGRFKSVAGSASRRIVGWFGKRKSPWDLAPAARGVAIERALGQNLPASFPVIDRFYRGMATSIKSIDLAAASYANPKAVSNRLNGYVDKVAAFRGDQLAGVSVRATEITGRQLLVTVPSGVATAAQQRALDAVTAYGATRGVYVRVVSVR